MCTKCICLIEFRQWPYLYVIAKMGQKNSSKHKKTRICGKCPNALYTVPCKKKSLSIELKLKMLPTELQTYRRTDGPMDTMNYRKRFRKKTE